MSKNTLVSVIMPVYNEKTHYLRKSIESILNQTYSNFEFIIIDDCSEDYVAEIISQYKDSRIFYQRQYENSKISICMNNGLMISEGKYIAIMHSDDEAIRSRLEKQVQVLDEYDNVGLVNSYSILRKGFNDWIHRPRTDSNELKLVQKYICNSIVCPNVMLRKSVLTDNALWFDNNYVLSEDYKMWDDMMPYCDFYTVPEILLIYNKDVNPKRQNHQIQKGQECSILLKNYVEALNLSLYFKNLSNKLRDGEQITERDYRAICKQVEKLPAVIQPKVSTGFYYSFLSELRKTLQNFNPEKAGNYGI